jgi:hypothetical protein
MSYYNQTQNPDSDYRSQPDGFNYDLQDKLTSSAATMLMNNLSLEQNAASQSLGSNTDTNSPREDMPQASANTSGNRVDDTTQNSSTNKIGVADLHAKLARLRAKPLDITPALANPAGQENSLESGLKNGLNGEHSDFFNFQIPTYTEQTGLNIPPSIQPSNQFPAPTYTSDLPSINTLLEEDYDSAPGENITDPTGGATSFFDNRPDNRLYNSTDSSDFTDAYNTNSLDKLNSVNATNRFNFDISSLPVPPVLSEQPREASNFSEIDNDFFGKAEFTPPQEAIEDDFSAIPSLPDISANSSFSNLDFTPPTFSQNEDTSANFTNNKPSTSEFDDFSNFKIEEPSPEYKLDLDELADFEINNEGIGQEAEANSTMEELQYQPPIIESKPANLTQMERRGNVVIEQKIPAAIEIIPRNTSTPATPVENLPPKPSPEAQAEPESTRDTFRSREEKRGFVQSALSQILWARRKLSELRNRITRAKETPLLEGQTDEEKTKADQMREISELYQQVTSPLKINIGFSGFGKKPEVKIYQDYQKLANLKRTGKEK